MFGAVVNSLQAIEDAGSASVSPSIDIVVGRDAVLDGLEITGEVNGFTITDMPEEEVFIARACALPDARYGAVYPARGAA